MATPGPGEPVGAVAAATLVHLEKSQLNPLFTLDAARSPR